MKHAIVLLCFLLAACDPAGWYRYVSVQSLEPDGKIGPGRMKIDYNQYLVTHKYGLVMWVKGKGFKGNAIEPPAETIADYTERTGYTDGHGVDLLALGVSEQILTNSNGIAVLSADDGTEMKCVYSVDDDDNATGVCGTSDGKLYKLQMQYGGVQYNLL